MAANIQTFDARPKERGAGYFLPPDVILVTVEDGSARILDMAGGFHAVPAIGARMLQETLTNGAAAAATRIAEEYRVDRQQVQDDLADFLRNLESQKLLNSQRSRPRRNAVGLARLLLRPALHGAHGLLGSPEKKARTLLALSRLSFALFGWMRTVAVWQEAHAHFPARQAGVPDAEIIQALDRIVRAAVASHPIPVACKERALCSWSLARAAGLHAALVVGIDLFPMAGHCWCEVGPQTLGDDRDRCDHFTAVGRW
jgi:transglutaminase superfamily protein/coenzyme PQQ synthesis protein D (PqqD)